MKIVEVINDGLEQSIKLPHDCHLESSEVIVKRVGRSLVLTPKDVDPWQIFTQGIESFTNDFMQERLQPEQQDRQAPFQ
ncbi:antitoxin [Pirellulaceae bacterium SH449]